MRASGPFSDDRCRNAGSSSSAAARKVTNSPGDALVFCACHSATVITIATPTAPSTWAMGVAADHATCMRIAKPRSLSLIWQEPAIFVLRPFVDLDHALALVRLLDRARHLAEHRLVFEVEPPQTPTERAQRDADRRSDDHRQQRQLPVVIEEHAEQAEDDQRIAYRRAHHLGRKVEGVRRLVDELRDDNARRGVLEGRRRPVQHAVEHRHAQVHQHRLRHPVEQVRATENRQATHDEEPDKGDRHPDDRLELLLEERLVGEDPGQTCDQRLRGGTDARGDQAEHQKSPMRQDHAQQAAQVRVVKQAGMGGTHVAAAAFFHGLSRCVRSA